MGKRTHLYGHLGPGKRPAFCLPIQDVLKRAQNCYLDGCNHFENERNRNEKAASSQQQASAGQHPCTRSLGFDPCAEGGQVNIQQAAFAVSNLAFTVGSLVLLHRASRGFARAIRVVQKVARIRAPFNLTTPPYGFPVTGPGAGQPACQHALLRDSLGHAIGTIAFHAPRICTLGAVATFEA